MSSQAQALAAEPPAALAAPATPAPMTTASVQADLKAYLTTPVTKPEPAAAAPAPSPANLEPPALEPAAGTPGLAEPDLEEPPNAEWPESAQKRVDRLTRRRKEAETQREAEKLRADKAEQELAALKATPPKPTDDPSKRSEPANQTVRPTEDRFDAIPEVKAARDEQGKHAATFQLSQQLLEQIGTSGSVPEKVIAALKQHGVDISEHTTDEVRGYLSGISNEAILKHSSAAAKVQNLLSQAERNLGGAQAQFTSQAHTLLPELADPKTAEYAEAQKALTRFPWLADEPQRDLYIAALIEGNRALQAKAKRMLTAQTPRPATTTPTTPPTAGLPANPAVLPAALPPVTSDVLRDKAFKSGNADDMAAYTKSLF